MSSNDQGGPTRKFTVFAQDPGVRRRGKILTTQVEVPSERLRDGPAGHRAHVIDYDASTDRLLVPAKCSLHDVYGEADPSDMLDDPCFHAQNVYAIVMRTLARFEFALGRRVRWGFQGHQIKVVPHAFSDANAYYSRDDEALMFGYFPGKRRNIFTCLSHDIVAHETAHALVDGIRRNYLLPSSPQQAAFHEGFADVVAILSVLAMPEVLDATLQPHEEHEDGVILSREALSVAALRETSLLKLAEEMGRELKTLRGEALRHSSRLPRSPRFLETRTEPHELGEVLVAAMLNTFLEVWVRRLFPHGRRGVQALDRTHVVNEGATAADHLLNMAIRALDYAPPVDLQFGDFLSALLTADTELHPEDGRYGYRETLLEVFGQYGIAPSASAWGSESGVWMPPEYEVSDADTTHAELHRDPEAAFRFLWQNRDELRLEPNAYTYVESVRPTVRVNRSGFLLHETVVEYVQVLDLRADELNDYGVEKPPSMRDWQPVRLYGGAALIFDDRARLRLNIGSGVASRRQSDRLRYLFETGHFDDRGAVHTNLERLHRLRGGAPSLADPYRERRES